MAKVLLGGKIGIYVALHTPCPLHRMEGHLPLLDQLWRHPLALVTIYAVPVLLADPYRGDASQGAAFPTRCTRR